MDVRSHNTHASQMPLLVKLILYAIAFLFATVSVSFAWRVLVGQGAWELLLSGIFVIAIVGLLRRLAWARFLVSCVSVLSSFAMAALFMPDIDDRYNRGPVLERMLGSMPPLWVAWLLIVLAAAFPLIPAIIIGWRKNWFRGELW